jgi:D-sedoheptulose 7-phosphate isomerase
MVAGMSSPNWTAWAEEQFRASIAPKEALLADPEAMELVSQLLALAYSVVKARRKFLVCGNGGSAADAQHIAAELVGHFERDRRPYAALALSENVSSLTGIGNDYDFRDVFARQVVAFGEPGDLLLCLSTSGNSENIVRAARAGRERGLYTVALTGADGGRLADAAAVTLRIPSRHTPRIQETQLLIGHLMAAAAEMAIDA